jgi:hypothetical protein
MYIIFNRCFMYLYSFCFFEKLYASDTWPYSQKKTSRLKGSGLDLDLKQRHSSLIPGKDFVES